MELHVAGLMELYF